MKSIASSIAPHSSRSYSSIEKCEEITKAVVPVISKRIVYASYQSLIDRSKLLKAVGWNISYSIDHVKLEKTDALYSTPKIEIYIDDSLGFTIRIFGWLLPENHILYKEHFRSIRYITLSALMNYGDTFILCAGVNNVDLTKSAFQKHVISKKFTLFNIVDDDIDEQSRVDETIFYRSASCNLLSTDIVCDICHHLKSIEIKSSQKKERNMLTPTKLNARVSATAPEKIVLTLRQQRNDIKDQKVKIEELQYEIKKHSVTVTPDLHTDLQDIFNNCDKRKISPFMKLFWEEQLKKSASQVRYHPMIIKFCLALYAKSPAACDHLRFNEKEGTGCII